MRSSPLIPARKQTRLRSEATSRTGAFLPYVQHLTHCIELDHRARQAVPHERANTTVFDFSTPTGRSRRGTLYSNDSSSHCRCVAPRRGRASCRPHQYRLSRSGRQCTNNAEHGYILMSNNNLHTKQTHARYSQALNKHQTFTSLTSAKLSAVIQSMCQRAHQQISSRR